MSDAPNRKIIILGGGISGLVTAYKLNKWRKETSAPVHITLVEATDRLGGIIETKTQGGFMMERGPDAFFTEKPWAFDLIKELGLEDQVIETNPTDAKSFILSGGKLRAVPTGFHLIAPANIRAFLTSSVLSIFGKLRVLLEMFLPRRRDAKDETLASFVRRRFGTEAYKKIGQPMLGGIYSGNPELLSLQATMPRFIELEAKYGSLIRGLREQAKLEPQKSTQASGPRYRMFLSFKNGMQTLTDALAKELDGVEILFSKKVDSIKREEGWTLGFRREESIYCDLLVSTLPSKAASRLFKKFYFEMEANLSSIAQEPIAMLCLGYKRSQVGHSLNGFGFVVPEYEKRNSIGCTFVSTKFAGRAPEDHVLVRVFAGGAFRRELIKKTPEEITAILQTEISEILSIQGSPVTSDLTVYSQAMPQFEIGYPDRMKQLADYMTEYPGLYLTGNYFEGVGIPQIIHHATETARKVTEDIKLPVGV